MPMSWRPASDSPSFRHSFTLSWPTMARHVQAVLTRSLVAGTVWVCLARRTQVIGWLRHEATYQGKPTSYWTRAMQAGTEDVGKSLREGGSEAVPVLCEMLRDPDENVRRQVLLTLGFGETTW